MPTRPTPRTRTRTRTRVRLLAAALTAVAALALTACNDGQGLRDEGPSSAGTLTGSCPLTGSASYDAGDAPARCHAEPPSGNS
ncbi:hypothetical protein [Streptomyces sp. 3214.6]|uniref:hypothetical protein n=1 Tax=Streptomyces sp. 3214.6 TaxID=1882757 RepID=UPI00090C09BD|nr:hypothetical protein [Streptomyces sp. 3214.6]SHI09261.1 hypothetical protein SAMN05444521_3857 [Streptomyces sp. 3214.6]